MTGFLGAGKTTLIRNFLKSPEGSGTALIVNEFGEIGIDDALLREGSETTALLGNGCLCCVSQNDLQLTLSSLFAERSSGRVPNFERIIIETSGLADPSAVLQTLSSNRTIAERFALAALVCVVDVALAGVESQTNPEWLKQIAMADRIVFSKSDLASPEAFQAAIAASRSSNPFASAHRADRGELDPHVLASFAETPSVSSLMRCEAAAESPVAHASAYRSFSLIYDDPPPWAAFEMAMRALTELRGPDILRVKGFVGVEGRPGPVVVHAVQHLVHPPEELTSWPDSDRRTRLVFITRNVDKRETEALFGSVIALARPAYS